MCSALSNKVNLFSQVAPAETLLFLHFQFLYILGNSGYYLAFIFYYSLRCDFNVRFPDFYNVKHVFTYVWVICILFASAT